MSAIAVLIADALPALGLLAMAAASAATALPGFRGEIDEVTRMVYDARENCLDHIRIEAEELRADGVIGVKLFIHEIGAGLVEPG